MAKSGSNDLNFEIDCDLRDGHRMRQRDQLRRALGTLNRRDTGDAQHITLLGASRADELQGRRLHRNAPAGDGDAMGDGLVADVDHLRPARAVKVSKRIHSSIVGQGACNRSWNETHIWLSYKR